MKFNPIKGLLYSSQGSIVKELRCPIGVTWDSLEGSPGAANKRCKQCSRDIRDILNMSELETIKMLQDDPTTCVRIDLNDPKIKVVNHDEE